MNEQIFRYPEQKSVNSKMDPFDDVVSWIRRLRSFGFVSNLLKSAHGMSTKSEIETAAKAIKVLVDGAVALLEQAFASDPQVSYLPAYYAMANLAKVAIIAKGYQSDLERHRRHGATWTGRDEKTRSLLTDHITLREKGEIPLYYQAITNLPLSSSWGKTKIDPRVRMKSIYPYILDVGHEYIELTGCSDLPLSYANVYLRDDPERQDLFFINVRIKPLKGGKVSGRRRYKIIRGLMKVGEDEYRSSSGVKEDVLSKFPRYLLYDYELATSSNSGVGVTITPISGSNLLMPEEMLIYLAFFHLSSVVRYDPERLYRFFDSDEISLLLALSKHGVFRFLLLFWSFITNTSYQILSQ